jgi:hypothetical protein
MTSAISVLIDGKIERPSIEHVGETGDVNVYAAKPTTFRLFLHICGITIQRSTSAFQKTMTHL